MRIISWQQALRLKFYVFMVVLLVSLMINQGHSSMPQSIEDTLSDIDDLVRYKKSVESGSTEINGRKFPHQVEFTLATVDQKVNHKTIITARRYYKVGTQERFVTPNEPAKPFTVRHSKLPTPSSTQLQFNVDIDWTLSRPQFSVFKYYRPEISLCSTDPLLGSINLPELNYGPLEICVARHAVNACALMIQHQGKIIEKPLFGDYTIKGTREIPPPLNPYLYYTGAEFFLVNALTANYLHANEKLFTFFYAVQSSHKIIRKPDCRLQIKKDKIIHNLDINLPFAKQPEEDFQPGLYKRKEDDTWIGIQNNFGRKGQQSYTFSHPDGPWIQEVQISSGGGTNQQVLEMLDKLTYWQDIAGLDLGGRVFSSEDQKQLSELLARMGQLSTLNLTVMDKTADYNALVPALLNLPNLVTLKVVNCGLSTENIRRLNRQPSTYALGLEQNLPFKLLGFSGQETTHQWTEGDCASIEVPLTGQLRGLKCISFIDAHGHVGNGHDQGVIVSVNDKPVGGYNFNEKNPIHTIHVPIPEGTDQAVIKFKTPHAKSPAQLTAGKNPDHRKLGFYVNQVNLLFSTLFYNLAIGHGFPYTLEEGFSDPEGNLRWSEGNLAKIRVPIRPHNLGLKCISFIDTHGHVGKGHTQGVIASINGKPISNYNYSCENPIHTIHIPIPDGIDEAVIDFQIPDAISPNEVTAGKNPDPRKLGILFKYVEFSFAKVFYNLATANQSPFDLKGFSAIEGTHRWTDGKKASIKVPARHHHQRLKSVTFKDTCGFIPSNHSQSLIIKINNAPFDRQYDYSAQLNKHTIHLPIPENIADATIEFEIPHAKSPAEVPSEQNPDPRALGIAFKEIELEYAMSIQH